MNTIPVIVQEKCDGCGLCVNVCRGGALTMAGNVVSAVETGNCDWCANCEAVCNTGAIGCPFEIVAGMPA